MFDDVCTFDENGICNRHKVKHEGRYYRLSQDRSNVGYQYRKSWDSTTIEEKKENPVNFDDICTFDGNQVCIRHGFKHEGKAKDLSQERTLRGHRIRKQWDTVKAKGIVEKKSGGCGCGGTKGNLH